MRRPTLRTKTTVLATALTAVILTGGSFALVRTLDARLTAGADDLAQSRVRDLTALAASGGLPATITNVGDDGVAQVVTADGRVLAASPNIKGDAAIARFAASDLEMRTVRAPDDAETETYRLWAGSGTSASGPVRVYVGTSLESVREATRTLRRSLLIGVPLVVFLIGAGTWWAVGRALRRVDRLRADVDAITDQRLDRRVSGSGADDELGRLAATMNRMLGRLETSVNRQREFVADVSHDLQSPLATQRAQLEVAMSGPASIDLDDVGQTLLSTTAEMEGLVADLLLLAAADAQAPTRPELIDLDDIVLEEATRARTTAVVPIDTTAVSAAPARAPAGDLRRAVRNLIDNAVEHATSAVVLSLRLDHDDVRLEVIDDGPGVPLADRERVFDRFYRSDTARTRGTGSGGTGLGLAIARTVAERAGGSLRIEASDHGARFVLRLPTTGVDTAQDS